MQDTACAIIRSLPLPPTIPLLLWYWKHSYPCCQWCFCASDGHLHMWTALSASDPAHSNASRHPVGGRGVGWQADSAPEVGGLRAGSGSSWFSWHSLAETGWKRTHSFLDLRGNQQADPLITSSHRWFWAILMSQATNFQSPVLGRDSKTSGLCWENWSDFLMAVKVRRALGKLLWGGQVVCLQLFHPVHPSVSPSLILQTQTTKCHLPCHVNLAALD